MSGWAGFFIAAAIVLVMFDGKPNIQQAIVQSLTQECPASGATK